MIGESEYMNLRMAHSFSDLMNSTLTGYEVLRGLRTDRGMC